MENGAFLVYAKYHWLLHLSEIGTNDHEMWTLFCKCIEDRSLPSMWRWDLPVQISPVRDNEYPNIEQFVRELHFTLGRGEQKLAWAPKHKRYVLLLYFTVENPLGTPRANPIVSVIQRCNQLSA